MNWSTVLYVASKLNKVQLHMYEMHTTTLHVDAKDVNIPLSRLLTM